MCDEETGKGLNGVQWVDREGVLTEIRKTSVALLRKYGLVSYIPVVYVYVFDNGNR
jgi:hypothetical protein